MTRTVIITGASSGIGREAAKALSKGGAELAIVGRNPERTRAVADEVGGSAFIADFDRLDDVRGLAERLLDRYPRIDVLANNAGGLVNPRGVTADGHERILQSNHLAPFLLTRLLLPRLIESEARVVSTASVANLFGRVRLDDLDWAKRPWLGGWRQYGTSKIETILFIRELAKRTGLEAFSFHPGIVKTNFGADSSMWRMANVLTNGHYGISAAAGALPLIQLAGPSTIGVPSGTYFDQLKPDGLVLPQAKDASLAAALWERSSELVGLPSEV
ncbi:MULTISPECIES: SDR family NAD(P)-dependent oxidoreductase [unclassified Frigoribacterium]|uniref:SDR family NAD(P)-dependent oxidoreductase n=1 Tax=unclassified Frigoribacterium TaxID=2627005 RepID=UPI0006F830B7|nr:MULTISPECIES: SDR family NAD(P)-dependent oxidoreductase [unclassified Frigoribacterium]KQO82632.1 short-chain dehydrogenase [Frigoribacterium sp. Leaf263]KQR64685.1 short-chain dehydrogenase [Frigoribacterium sp. Leaf172]